MTPNTVDILSAVQRAGNLIQVPHMTTRSLTYEEAQATLAGALANVCECYNIPVPTTQSPSDIISFALMNCDKAGQFKTLAFSFLARSAMYAASYVEERDGYPNMQHHVFQAIHWAAEGASSRMACYVLHGFEEHILGH